MDNERLHIYCFFLSMTLNGPKAFAFEYAILLQKVTKVKQKIRDGANGSIASDIYLFIDTFLLKMHSSKA